MLNLTPDILDFISRLRTVPEYAESEGISRVQAHRRIEQKKVDTVEIRKRLYIVLPRPT